MTADVNVVLADMPATIPGYSIANPDASYTIVINSRLNHEQQEQAYDHELFHIKNGDHNKQTNADALECYAHALT